MLRLKRISEMMGMKVFTDSGDYFGEVEEAILTKTKVYGWRVRATRNSFLERVLGGGAKGVVVPQTLVQNIGDVMIIASKGLPTGPPPEEAEKKEAA